MTFATPSVLLQGAITGFIFGFLLQKGKVSKFDVIVKQLVLKDFTVIKIMLTAVLVGGVGIYCFQEYGLISSISIEPARLLANSLGGIIFGIGMAILGFCPGTAVAAAGEGATDALWGILGLIVGSAFYAEAYPYIKENIMPVGDIGEATLISLTNLPTWIIFLIIAAFIIIGMHILEKKAL